MLFFLTSEVKILQREAWLSLEHVTNGTICQGRSIPRTELQCSVITFSSLQCKEHEEKVDLGLAMRGVAQTCLIISTKAAAQIYSLVQNFVCTVHFLLPEILFIHLHVNFLTQSKCTLHSYYTLV